jgi:hypothetical protein
MYFENKEITIETTNKCAAKCIMCPREKLTQALDVMSLELYQKIVTDAFNEGVKIIDLCGYGDVFLDKTILEKMKWTKKVNPESIIYISTTGNAMLPKYHEYILEYGDILKFSIYGNTKETYEHMMGGIKYEKSIRNIESFLEFDKEKKIYTIGNFIKMKENEHELEDWKKRWEPKLSEVYIWLPHNYTDGRNYRDISGQKQSSCGRPLKGALQVAVDGKAHVCCFDYNKTLIVGDTKTMTIDEIMNSKELKTIQEKHRNADFSGLICESCDQTVHDEKVLIYKTNPNRKVGMENSSLYVYK